MEDRGDGDRVGAAFHDRLQDIGGAAGRSVSKPDPVPSRSIEVTSSSPAPSSTARLAHSSASSPERSRPLSVYASHRSGPTLFV